MIRRRASLNLQLIKRINDLETQLERKNQQLERVTTSTWFGCLTRNGVDEVLLSADLTGLSLVYFDLDELKKANDKWGKPESSRRVAEVISQLRSADIIIGQWFSGDEFLCLVPSSTAAGFAHRCLSLLHEQEMSATFVIVNIKAHSNIPKIGEACDKIVNACKKRGRRGSINLLVQ
jgi:GGDEF domain-containing protein